MTTHTVTNQPPPLAGRNLFTDNRPLVEALCCAQPRPASATT